MADPRVQELADRLCEAERERQPVAPLTDDTPNLSLEDAYRIQQINIKRRLASGEKIYGHKIGLTAKAMQELFGVDEPDYGHLLDSMVLKPGEPLDLSELIDPQVEVEPAFVMKSDLMGPGLDGQAVLDATDYVTVCFEVIDSRIADWKIKLQDTVADNGSSARVLLGDGRVDPTTIVLDDLETVLEIDGEVAETGNTSAILDHPANGVAWLANALAQFGVGLKSGDVVLPGTCTRSCRIHGKSTLVGRIDGLGEVRLELTGAPTVRPA